MREHRPQQQNVFGNAPIGFGGSSSGRSSNNNSTPPSPSRTVSDGSSGWAWQQSNPAASKPGSLFPAQNGAVGMHGVGPGSAGSGSGGLFGGGNISMPSSLTLGRAASAPLGGSGGGFNTMRSSTGAAGTGSFGGVQQFGGQSQPPMPYSGQQQSSQQLYGQQQQQHHHQQQQFGGAAQVAPPAGESPPGYGGSFPIAGMPSGIYGQPPQVSQAALGQQQPPMGQQPQQWAPQQQGSALGVGSWNSGVNPPGVPAVPTPAAGARGGGGSWGNSEWQGMGGMGASGGKQSGSSGLNAPADPWKVW